MWTAFCGNLKEKKNNLVSLYFSIVLFKGLFTTKTVLGTSCTEKLIDDNSNFFSPEQSTMCNSRLLLNICLQWYQKSKQFKIITNFKKTNTFTH